MNSTVNFTAQPLITALLEYDLDEDTYLENDAMSALELYVHPLLRMFLLPTPPIPLYSVTVVLHHRCTASPLLCCMFAPHSGERVFPSVYLRSFWSPCSW